MDMCRPNQAQQTCFTDASKQKRGTSPPLIAKAALLCDLRIYRMFCRIAACI